MSLLAHDDSAGMPWKESSAMKERVKFVLEWESRWEKGEGRRTAQLRGAVPSFGISRQTGDKWVDRFFEFGEEGDWSLLEDVRGGRRRWTRPWPT